MKASETHLGRILGGDQQFSVPLFQRPYTRDESRWKVLWTDLVERREDVTDSTRSKPHFIGSIVTVPTRSAPEGVTTYAHKTLEHGWSRSVLTAQMASRLHPRSGKAITNFARTLPPDRSDFTREVLKDPDTFDFLASLKPLTSATWSAVSSSMCSNITCTSAAASLWTSR